jgi:hypothetical protein
VDGEDAAPDRLVELVDLLQDAGTGLPTDPDRVAVQSEPDSEDRLDHVVVQVTGSFSPR